MNRRKFFTALASVPFFGAVASFASDKDCGALSNLPYPALQSRGQENRFDLSADDPFLEQKLNMMLHKKYVGDILRELKGELKIRTFVIRSGMKNPVIYVHPVPPKIYNTFTYGGNQLSLNNGLL